MIKLINRKEKEGEFFQTNVKVVRRNGSNIAEGRWMLKLGGCASMQRYEYQVSTVVTLLCMYICIMYV